MITMGKRIKPLLLFLALVLTGYVAAQAPELVLILPSNGPESGGTLIELEGTDFGTNSSDLIAITVGSQPCAVFEYISPTAATCVTPPGSGEALVVLETVEGVSNELPFTYNAPPLVTSISPDNGLLAGLTIVGIIGTRLGQQGADIVSVFMAGVRCASYDFLNSTYIRCLSGKAEGVSTGPVIVTTLPGGVGTSQVNYTYNPVPEIVSITPNNGPYTGSTLLHINGTNLAKNLADIASVTVQGLACGSIAWISSSQVTCNTPTSLPSTSGPVVIVNKSGGTSNNNTLFIYNKAPRITLLDPDNGPTAGTTVITITGTDLGLSRGDIASILFGQQPCANITYVSATSLSCAAPANPVGIVSVSITTHSGGPSVIQAEYEYNPVPVVLTVNPDHGPLRGGTEITITGTDIGRFAADVAQVLVHKSPCNDITFLTQDGLKCTTTPSETDGPGSVVVTTYAGGASNSNVNYNYVRASHVDSVDPTSGPQGGGTLIDIDGDSFGTSVGDIVEIQVAGVQCEDIEFISSTHLKCVTGNSPIAGRGPVLVTTRFGEQGTSSIEYTYNLAPYITEVEPSNGPMSGGTRLTIFGNSLGTELADIVSVVIDSIPCLNLALVTDPDLAITCETGPKTSGNQGPGPVVVTTHSGGESNTNVRYTYNPAPRTTRILPAEGPESGGTPVRIQGTNLGVSEEDILEITIAGSSCRSSLVYTSPSLIDCTTSEKTTQLTGPVIVTTNSGGSGAISTNVNFTYNGNPVISGIAPDWGQALSFTTVTITGSKLGKSLEDIVDVEIAGYSCLFSLVYRDESTLMCMLAPIKNMTSGSVVVTTVSGGSSKNTDVQFTYDIGCFQLVTEELCTESLKECIWCAHAYRCLDDHDSCVQSKTASTVTIVVLTTTALVGVLIAVGIIFHFANRDDNLMRDLKNNKLGPSSKRAQNDDNSDTDSDHSVVVETYEGGDETVDINENDWDR